MWEWPSVSYPEWRVVEWTSQDQGTDLSRFSSEGARKVFQGEKRRCLVREQRLSERRIWIWIESGSRAEMISWPTSWNQWSSDRRRFCVTFRLLICQGRKLEIEKCLLMSVDRTCLVTLACYLFVFLSPLEGVYTAVQSRTVGVSWGFVTLMIGGAIALRWRLPLTFRWCDLVSRDTLFKVRESLTIVILTYFQNIEIST